MILRSMFVSLLSLISADACDVVMLLNRDALKSFCQGDSCTADSPPFNVQKNSEICLMDDYAEKISLVVSDIFWKVRYELAYFTSDYTNEVRYACACCNQTGDGECGASGPCTSRAKDQLKATHSIQNDSIFYHCIEGDRDSDTNCVFQKPSTRTGPLYGVLRYTGEKATVKITINGTNVYHEIQVSSDQHFTLSNFGISSSNFLSVTLLNSSSGASSNRSLLRYDDEFFVVESAEREKPTQGLFGDFQVAWETNKETHVIPYATCVSKGDCAATCTVPQTSMISSFQLRKNSLERPNITNEGKTVPLTVQTIEKYRSSAAFIRLELWGGDWGKCDVEPIGSYGCSSCSDAASVILKTSNIERIGFIPFWSNCSFKISRIECATMPTELFMKEGADSCHFRMLTQDEEFTVEVQYSKFGRTVKSEARKQQCGKTFESSGEALWHLAKNEQFLVAFLGTTVTLTLASILLQIFFKLIVGRESYRVTEIETDLVDL